MATEQPVGIRMGVALERHYGGGQTIRAVTCIPALTGAWRHVGGGVTQFGVWEHPYKFDVMCRPDLIPEGTRVVSEPADRTRADRRAEARPAHHVDDVLELESGHAGARDRQDRRRPDARGPVHGLGRALHLGHRLLRRHPAAGHDGRGDGGHDPVLGSPLPDLQHEVRGRARRGDPEQRDLPPARRAARLRGRELQVDRQRVPRALRRLGVARLRGHRSPVHARARLRAPEGRHARRPRPASGGQLSRRRRASAC